jgi:Ni/Fe-hydrogenase subunit HybB-like protein
LFGLTRVAAWVMALFLALKFGDLLLAGEFGLLFSSGVLSLVFWVEVLLLVAAMVIYLSKLHENENTLMIGTICTLVWLAINRSTVAWFALRAPAGATYVPTWIEIGIVIACFAAGILFYALGVRSLPALREGVIEEGHH